MYPAVGKPENTTKEEYTGQQNLPIGIDIPSIPSIN